MLVVPTQAVPNQVFSTVLNSQFCTINLYQKSTGLFVDIMISNVLILSGVLCLHANLIIRDAYFNFSGDFAIFDLQGTEDPVSTGLGSRWVLAYLAPTDLPDGLS